MIEIKDLRKSYGKTEALKGISFEVEDGEAFAFLGPNGAGKSTTIKIMMGFLRPDSGAVKIFGKDISVHGKEVRKRIGFLPEEIGFYENLSVYDNMDFYARLFGIPKLERSKVINEILDQVGLSDRKRSKVKELSHGLKQRLGIAQSLINHPDLLIYDEPTSGLDPRSSYEIRELIKSLLKGGVTLFLSSHLLYEVQQICDGVVIIDKGRLVKRGKIKDLVGEMEGHLVRAKITCLNLDAEIANSVKKIDGVKVIDSKNKTILVEAKDEEMIANINSTLVRMGGKVSKIEYISPDLEEVFLKLTGDNK